MALSPIRIAETQEIADARPLRQPLGRHLVESGAITPEQLVKALHLQLRLAAPLGEILVAEGWASEDEVQNALSDQFSLAQVDLQDDVPDAHLCQRKSAQFWLSHCAIPLRRSDGTVLIAISRPDRFDHLRQELADLFGPVRAVLARQDQITGAIADMFRQSLAQMAASRVLAKFSCRNWARRMWTGPVLAMTGVAALMAAAPIWGIGFLSLLAFFAIGLFTTLKLAAFAVHLCPAKQDVHKVVPGPPGPMHSKRPKVSILVPLFKEQEIASALIKRLSCLTYPKALLDVVLVLEEHDEVTRSAIQGTRLPAWMRVIEVPALGNLTTKPRAMNYALNFCNGDIIGVWDAEDAPASDQIEKVVERFCDAPDDVVCLQGVLDYYNPRTNWLARCFSIEYSAWFRIILPGMARLGMVVPLGGTTLFFRRDRLEELGAWDAHNVTEDADLGMRLCRFGWRTEMIDTATYEEANYRPWPWIKQRSRWHKGFMATYLVHMRAPVALFRDLGALRFFSFQAFFLGTLGQFLLAPVIWSYWLLLITGWHPLITLTGSSILIGATAFLVLVEGLNIALGISGAIKSERRYLIPWVATMMFYFPLATVAAYKALWELITTPYYWDKTQHGLADAEAGAAN